MPEASCSKLRWRSLEGALGSAPFGCIFAASSDLPLLHCMPAVPASALAQELLSHRRPPRYFASSALADAAISGDIHARLCNQDLSLHIEV